MSPFLVLLQALLVASYHPVFFFNGLGCSLQTANVVAMIIKRTHTNTEVFTLPSSCGENSLNALQTQVDEAILEIRRIIAADPATFEAGYHFLGHSQGGVIARAVAEEMDDHNVIHLISLAAPHLGVYGDYPLAAEEAMSTAAGQCMARMCVPVKTGRDTHKYAHMWLAQKHFSVANLWHDPYEHHEYLKRNVFLPKYNAEKLKINFNYKANLSRVRKQIYLGSPDDGLIKPWASQVWGFDYFEQPTLAMQLKQENEAPSFFGSFLSSLTSAASFRTGDVQRELGGRGCLPLSCGGPAEAEDVKTVEAFTLDPFLQSSHGDEELETGAFSPSRVHSKEKEERRLRRAENGEEGTEGNGARECFLLPCSCLFDASLSTSLLPPHCLSKFNGERWREWEEQSKESERRAALRVSVVPGSTPTNRRLTEDEEGVMGGDEAKKYSVGSMKVRSCKKKKKGKGKGKEKEKEKEREEIEEIEETSTLPSSHPMSLIGAREETPTDQGPLEEEEEGVEVEVPLPPLHPSLREPLNFAGTACFAPLESFGMSSTTKRGGKGETSASRPPAPGVRRKWYKSSRSLSPLPQGEVERSSILYEGHNPRTAQMVMEDLVIYKEDRLGLRRAKEEGRLEVKVVEGVGHNDWFLPYVFLRNVLPLLT